MGLKILHTADWHLDSPFTSFSEPRREFLRQEQSRIPERIGEILKREKSDLVLLAGDIFDGIPSRQTVERLKRTLASWQVPVFVAPGNHDFCGSGSPWLEEAWPENVKVFTGKLESLPVPGLDCRIYGAGYCSMDCDPLLEGFRIRGEERYHIAVLHADPLNLRSPCCPVTAAQVRDSGLTYLALGHIHRAGSFSAGRTLCAWPGCPMGRGWDETEQKGVCLVTLEDTVSLQFLLLDGVRFYDREADVTGGAEAALDEILPGGESLDFFRITLTGQGTVDLKKLEQRYAQIPNLFLRDGTDPVADLWEDTQEDTFRGIYFRMLRQQAETDPRAALAAEISRKLLSGKEVRLP